MSNKIYKKLPVVLQTTAIKNFFESTVEQLFSKSNVEVVSGYIGSKSSADNGITGYIREPNNDKAHYALSPVVNTINYTTKESEDFIFFDELIDILATYGVDTSNQNKIFSANINSFVPPIDIDKFVNYQEYYWYPDGPTVIPVAGTLTNPIDIDRDIIGKQYYTPVGRKPFKNGMVVRFTGQYVIPSSELEIDYIVQGVGQNIYLVPRRNQFQTVFSTPVDAPFDGSYFPLNHPDIAHQAGNVSSVTVISQGIGYVNPTVSITGSNTNVVVATANVAGNGAITGIAISDAGQGYTGFVGVEVTDIDITYDIDTANIFTGSSNVVVTADIFLTADPANVRVGQSVSGIASGIVSKKFNSAEVEGYFGTYLTVPTANVNVGTETFTFANHGLTTDDEVIYDAGGGTPISSILTGGKYQVLVIDANRFQLKEPSDPSTIVFIADSGNNSQGFIKKSNTFTVTAVNDGSLTAGMMLHHNDLVYKTKIVSQLSGSTGSTGTYRVDVDNSTIHTFPETFNVKSTAVLSQAVELELNAVTAAPELTFAGRDFLAEVNYEWEGTPAIGNITISGTTLSVVDLNGGGTIKVGMVLSATGILPHTIIVSGSGSTWTVNKVQTLSTSTQFTGYPAGSRLGINPANGEYYLMGGQWSYDKNDLDDDDFDGDSLWDAGLNASPPEYLTIQRGAENKNIWSTINFWYHKDNFKDAGMALPNSSFRAARPIIEFDRRLELYNHGKRGIGSAMVACTQYTIDEVRGKPTGLLIDSTPIEKQSIIFPNEQPDVAKYVYVAYTDLSTETIVVARAPHPELNPIGAVDGDINFVPWELNVDDAILVRSGAENIGTEYRFTTTGLVLCQRKISVNQAPLFDLYDVDGDYLGDEGKYPNNNFEGNKIFSYSVGTGAEDKVLGFPLSWIGFKASSEIEFTVNMAEENYLHTYQPFGGLQRSTAGYKFYKLELDGEYELLSMMVPSDRPSRQRLVSKYTIDRFDLDNARREFWIGCIPDLRPDSSYDINVLVNGIKRTDWQYGTFNEGYIVFDTANFGNGDFIEISVFSSEGQLVVSDKAISKFELPLSWKTNVTKEEIISTSSPEFTQHFKNYMESQVGFEGDALQVNNFSSTPKDVAYATDIVVTDQDVILGALLLDDQPHNLVDAIRFNAEEYMKYKARLKKEISAYYTLFDTNGLSNEFILEKVLQNIISFNVGREVFNRTYVIPYGDNYLEERFEINDVNTTEFVSANFADLNKIENSLLVYHVNADNFETTLLNIDKDYTITNFNPITIVLTSSISVDLDDEIVLKLYNEDRDSAQCPPTPSILGIYPLFEPRIETDNSFQTPIQVLIGHDGSKTTLFGDRRDEVLLEFEKRVFNSARAEFRAANALPELNIYTLKPGAFRETGYETTEWLSLMRYYFSNWSVAQRIDFVTNEFYSDSNEWTWNYRGNTNLPGHWRGWYEHYYDTVRPHTHPWEMLAFFEKPLWWDAQYGTDYSSSNTAMWDDLEQGIIRQGRRENLTAEAYLINNPYRREGLHLVLPVDANSELRTPKNIISTGTTTRSSVWSNSRASGLDYRLDSFVTVNGLNVTHSNSNIYISGRNITNHTVDVNTNAVGFGPIEEQDVSYNLPKVNLNLVSSSPTAMPNYAVAVLVNGVSLYTPKSVKSWDDRGVWHYNNGTIENYNELATFSHSTVGGLFHYHSITPDVVGLTTGTVIDDGALKWDSSVHSPIVGWAFDGLPIYGPYGYRTYKTDNTPVNENDIVNIKSPWVLRQGTRSIAPGGAYTGIFVEDYEIDATKVGQSGFTNQFNLRYGTTPDSPATPIWFYVVTVDDAGKPMFPYAIGGGYATHSSSTKTWAGQYYAAGQDLSNNTLSSGSVVAATPALTSTLQITFGTTDARNDSWKFGDGAPAENAWKYTEAYPFAVTEALLLARPGKFATEFADPTKLYRPAANKKYKLSVNSNYPWIFTSATDFEIHGDKDDNGNFITNIGYTQFINSWLRFQGLSPESDFITKVRSLNTKLGHRMSGFIDKDTMTLRTDQYSNEGSATNLIIPQENITAIIHSSPYKSRNFYSGVIIEKTAEGYKVRGYDKNLGYFNTLQSDKNKGRERISVGGVPAQYVDYSQNTTYKEGTIVRYKGAYYSARETFKTSTTFEAAKWKRLGTLPQIGAATGTLYQQTTGNIIKVDYETVFDNTEDLFDFLISLGRYQENQGYTFGNFDETIGEVRDWAYAAKQLLFWTTGVWEIGNTLELSPMANNVTFTAPRGFIAKINRTDRSQFNIVNQNGVAINPTDCKIVRQDNIIEITPPAGEQIYGVVLFTKEIEHAFVVDNVTQFNDVIFNPVINQGHSRLKIKATRTAGWDGRFLSQGFIIEGDSLKPNLDNMAESLGRYHELGFIPVEKQLYEASRAVFGFEKKQYLTELDILDDQQYDFYSGMLQSKGTTGSLEKIGTVVPALSRSPSSEINVYDEWALRVADFGDTNQDQAIELKFDKIDQIQDPQLFTLAFPEDTTNIVEKIEVLERKHKYFNVPQIIISAPVRTNGVRATATATLNSAGELDAITVTNPGSGYGENVGVTVIAGEIVVDLDETVFETVRAYSTDYISTTSASLTGNLSITDFSGSSNVTTTVNLSTGISTVDELVDAINDANTGVTAIAIRSDVLDGGNATVDKYTLELRGSSFTINSADANLYLNSAVNVYQNGVNYTNTVGSGYRYEPRQRYGFELANNTVKADITVGINGVTLGESFWDFDPGDRWQVTTAAIADQNNPLTITLNSGTVNGSTTFANENYTTISNNNYPFVDVYVNGVLIENAPDETVYTLTASTVEFANISLLPKAVLTSLPNPTTKTSRFVLASQANVFVVEKGTIDFTNAFKGDVTGSTLSIKVETYDHIAIKLGTRRNYEITPDATDDDIILIDIDDSSRFLRKPIGSRENNLWPTLSNVNAYGLTTEKYATIPNAGYVNPANINFMAYDIASLPDLFDTTVIIKPAGGSLIHMAEDESKNWNVYKLQSIGSRVSFVETAPGTNEAVLFTDRSLFAYLDTNLIGNDNTSKYMDYYLTLKNANVSDNVVIWTNETIVQQKKALIKDPQPPKMVEARIKSIGPHPDSLIAIQNILPVSSKVYRGATASASSPSNIVTISGITNSDIRNGDAVQLVAGESTDYTFNANVTFNSVGNVTVDSANITFVTAPSFVTLLCDGDSTANGNIYYVKSKNVSANTFVIESDYFEDANVVSGLGNVRYVTSTFVDYGSISNHYIASNATTNAFTIELANVIEKTATFNGSITGTVLTVNTVTGGVLERGMRLSGTGIADNTFITSGSNLSWFVSNSQTVGNVNITAARPNVVDIRHMNLTKLATSSNHNLSPGDVVKVYANAWTGAYSIVSAPEANTVIISAPYTTDDKITGTIVRRGMQIRTTDPHGITKDSVELNKRVAVHFATPKVYNKIYRISSVGSDTINVLDDFAVNDTTSVYFDVASGFANNISNTFTIARRPILAATTVLYASNTQPVMAGDYYIDENLSNTTITFKNRILSEDANVSTGFVIVREPISTDFRYPVLTTVDHTKVTLNNSVVNISSYNNQQGMAESINRAIRLRRSAISQDSSGKLNVSFNMLTDFKTPVRIPDTDTKIKSSKIHNYGPYVRDEQALADLVGSSSPVKVAGEMKISDAVEYRQDKEFDTGPIYVGPLKGMRYTDSKGVSYCWDLKLRKYIPNYETVSGSYAPGLEFELTQATSVSDGSEAARSTATDLGNSEDLDNAVKKPSTPRGHSDGAKVLTIIPGTAESNPTDPTTKAVKWAEYDMSETVVYTSVTYPRWRLNTSEIWQFEVYEAVQNSAGTVYYILVDVVPADLPFAYDYFATVSAYNNFDGSITETVYYVVGGTEQSANTSIAWDEDRNDRSTNFKYIEIPPIEPAFYVGKQIISEPFAVKSGNGTNKLANFAFMPKDVIIGSASADKETFVLVTTPGHNSFLMWQPGLTPGAWEPNAEGPGLLSGSGGADVAWGFGRGYYTAGDNHVPDSVIFGDGATFNSIEDTNPYPGYNENGWSTRQTRFKYGKEFNVYPLQSPDSGFTYFDDSIEDPTDSTNTKIRADEIFIACFWTEPHTYVNQMIGFDYNNPDNDGNPTPVYKDYQGTITRVKYIRLTELPPDAVLRRPIADTGWGGKKWRNVITDEVLLPGETLPEGYAGPEGYGAFAPDQTLEGGSTGDDDESVDPTPVPGNPRVAAQRIRQIGIGEGFGRGSPQPYSAVTLVDERNLTPPAPVLTGSVLEGLPSACDVRAPNPVPPRNAIAGPCSVRPTVPKTGLLTEKTDNVGVDEEHVIKIQGKQQFLLIFDFSYDDGEGNKSVNGITIEQSDTADFSSGVKRYVIDTQANLGTVGETSGSQIGRYGFDTIPGLNTIIYKPAENALGVLTQRVLDNPLNKFETDRTIAATATNATTSKVLGVSGFGFLNRTIDCSQGQYVRITVSKGAANKTGKYALFVRYFTDAPNEVDVALAETVIDNCVESPSRAYKEGGIITGYTFSKSKSNTIFATLSGAAAGALLAVGTFATVAGATIVGAVGLTGAGVAAAGAIVKVGALVGLGPVGAVIAVGAILGAVLGGLFGKKKKGEGAGYFGSWKKKTSTFGLNEDNIYFPYSAPTQGMISGGVDKQAYVGGGAKQVQQIRLGALQGGTVTEYSTTEFKGYFFAPKSGTYNFEMESDDGSWLWVSPNDDLSGEEYYKSDGDHPELGNKNYTWQNAVVSNGGLHANRKASGSMYLKGGGLYFVRGIYGNGKSDGNFSVTIKGPEYNGILQFASRGCPEDDCGKFRAGELTNLDPVMKAVMEKLCPETPTFNPVTGGDTTGTGGGEYTYGEFNVPSNIYGGGGGGFADYTNFAVNFSGFSQPGLTGYNFMPASFKTPVKKKVVDPQKYGYSESLESGRYVNATSQRVTGGFTIPLAKKLTVVPRTSTPLRSYEIVDQPWYRANAKTLGNLNQTLRNINYAPKRIGTSVTLNGVPVNNITTDANSVDDENNVTITTLNEIPSTFATNANEVVIDLGGTADVPQQDAQLDNSNITFTKVPTINITPLTIGPNGDFVPAGPTAIANILRPTPQVRINATDLATIPGGTQLLFNEALVSFVPGTTPRDIANQIKCNQSGVDAQVKTNPDGSEILLIRSCSDNAIAIKNGCGGGTLKRVGDFHVVRGFEQTTTTTNTESCTSNATVLAPTTGFGNASSTQTPTGTYTLYDCGGNTTIFAEDTEIDTGFVLPSRTSTTTVSSTYQNGGSGYQIGDRLRLIGGTPTNNTRGPIGSICVNVAGAGYNNPANLRISFGGDNSPGTGAAAEVTSIDETNGSITGVRMLNYGVGYDVKNPPSVTITDISPRGPGSYLTVDAADLQGLTYYYNNIIEVQNHSVIDTSIIASGSTFYRVVANNIVLGAVTTIDSANVSNFEFTDVLNDTDALTIEVSNASLISGKIVEGGVITLLVTGDGTAAGNTVQSYLDNVAFTVDSVSGSTITIKDSYFTANVVSNISVLEFSLREPIESAVATGALRKIADQRMPLVPAELTAKIGVVDRNSDLADPTDNDSNPYAFIKGYKSLAGPLRVAKFIVTGVDDSGAITSLRVIDRGLYKVFPADLTQGIPLEYDYDFLGSPSWVNSNNLGVVDPSTQENTAYGAGHPEYGTTTNSAAPFVNGKHPNIITRLDGSKVSTQYPELKYDPINDVWASYTGSPGAYDPQTSIEINGQRLAKQYNIVLDPLDPEFGNYSTPLRIAGGTGARVFLTAEEVPDCSEKGRAKEDLGLPDQIADINVPQALADALNDALTGAGYLPEDIAFRSIPTAPGVGKLNLNTGYPSVNIDTNTPGFPEKLGIELGDYNTGMLCIEAEFVDPNLSDSQLAKEYENLYASGPFGLLSQEEIAKYTTTEALAAQAAPPTILSLLCVDSIKTDGPVTPDPEKYVPIFASTVDRLNPELQNTGFGADGGITYVSEYYKYDIRNIFGSPVTLQGQNKQNVNVFVFESQRYDNIIDYNENKIYLSDLEQDGDELANVWVDQFVNSDPANISMPDFIEGGWAYLENGVPQRWQTPLVDTNYVKNALMYDPDTGNKTVQFDLWDPFKGVLPGFISSEIHYISENDPVNYNNARTSFGVNNVGKVWWDTSSVKYMWYEQGSNRERWVNWGRTFPGSSITICEWVESKALPQNWSGNGTPRWPDKYIAERRINPETNKFVTYYYYWVQNRTVVDNRIKRSLGRQFDTETIARYIANPVGYGLTMASFVSKESFVLHNVSQHMKEENVIQINVSRNTTSDGIKHTAWKLVRENDNNSIIPDHISEKLIDSLCGENAIGQQVPDITLSEVEKYGISFRPRQTLFKDLKAARRVFRTVVNELLIDLKLDTQYSTWSLTLPDTLRHLERVNWYEVERIDNYTNTKIRYDSSYKPIFNVGSVGELYTLKNLPDGAVIQVKSSTSDSPQLWIYVSAENNFKLISIKNETLQVKRSIITGINVNTVAFELRTLMNILRDPIFNDIGLWNKVFFEMLKYAYTEQPQLNWAFKTSYLYIEKDEEDLIPTVGFKPDNFARIIEYMNEVKPFTSKIREYRDGKRPPIETIGATMVSDFDKPPYVDRQLGVVRVLDDFSQNDANIMFVDNAYRNYFSITNKGDNVFRHNNTKLVFDRTNYQLTQFGHNASTTPINLSIAQNIANINSMTESQITANAQMRAIDRIFKFDSEVRFAFAAEVSSHYNNITAGSNTSITTNATMLYDIINSGNLTVTLNLVKEKVGGGWRGETIDANVFSKVVAGLDPTDNFLTNFGWDTDPWDAHAFDRTVEVTNYEGIFSELRQGNITLRRNNETYEGFDGATFKKILYGEERPEELALLDPLESLIIDVYTNPYPVGNANTVIANTIVAPNAVPVKYRMHQNLFGDTEFIRISSNKTATVTANVYTYSTEITVDDASVFQTPRPGDPGIIWIGTERVLYERKDGNTFSQLTRGSAGTSIQDHLIKDIYNNDVVITVVEGSEEETFNRLDTNRAVWLEVGSEFYTYETYSVSNVAYADTVYADVANIATVGANQLTLTTTANAIALLNQGGVVAIAANGNLLTAEGTSYTVSYASNVTFFYIKDIDGANSTITVEDDLFMQDGMWDYYAFDNGVFDEDITEILNGNVTVTLEIPTLNTGANTALSLSDLANADYANTESLMKFIHGI